ncbi:MAG: type II toxin-antitoxin system PemK/MazF family toxin [Neisseriaceae bacterium]|nr:type II toxin-antitoxin system PemK/MazF family toxin [Neisseriaceae bacterium]
MKRGDIVTVALSGDYGKPRPAVVVQNDKVSLDSLILCLITSDVKTSQFRVFVEPSKETGLQKISQVMTDKYNDHTQKQNRQTVWFFVC